MRAVIQRVSRARVTVGERVVGEIGPGLVVLVAVGVEDTETAATYLAGKVGGLRIFEDDAGKMNLSVLDVGGEVLAVSQFTLYGDCSKGKRPSFTRAARPEKATQLYNLFCDELRRAGVTLATGEFQARMKVELVNDGPVTILVDSDKTF
jgi:D-tyrosyl-tRNA(Tyr) deacylase